MNLPAKKILVNGRLLPARAPALNGFDRGFLYGDGLYETVRVYDREIFLFSEHFRRFQSSARGLKIHLPFTGPRLASHIRRLLAANGLKEAMVRITVSRGVGPLGFDPRLALRPTWVVIATPPPPHPEKLYRTGIRLLLAQRRRNPPSALDPALKSTNNINNILAKMEAIQARAYEALMLNTDGYLAEGTISNVFFVRRGVLCTPALHCGILAGVTRDRVIRLARSWGVPVAEGRFRAPALLRAEEAFITSTTMEVMPVGVVLQKNRAPARLPAPGLLALRLRRAYRNPYLLTASGQTS